MKKEKKSSKHTQTPYSYISSGRARSLPLGDCFINPEWREAGLANIFIPRKHVTGNITYGIFLVDLLWKGVKDTDVHFNRPEEDIKELLFDSAIHWVPIDYNTAHNIIYGAEAFAAEYNIKAHPDFELSRMILQEDDDRIPIIDIEFGKDGKPFIITTIGDEEYRGNHYGSDDQAADDDDDDYPLDQDGYKGEEDDASTGNQPCASDYQWQQQNSNGDLAPLLMEWTSSQWEDFIADPKSQSQGDPFVDQVLLYVFDRCFLDINPDPELDWDAVIEKSLSQDFIITSNAVQTDHYVQSAEEKKLILECFYLFENGDDVEFRKQYKQKAKQLLAGIERWPDNKQLYNALQNFYIASGEDRKLEELLERTFKQFPGYLFGLANYANHNLKKGKSSLVPIIMNRAYNITDLYPERSLFHVSEIFHFNHLWLQYFTSTKEIMKARHYRIQLQENVPPEYNDMKKLQKTFEQSDKACIAAIKFYLDQASKDAGYRKMIIDILMNYSIISRAKQ